MESKLRQATEIVKRLRSAGHEAYFVGGCVRDMVMRKQPTDYDIATSAHPDAVQQLFRKTIPVGVQFGVLIVLEGEYDFQVATFRSDHSYTDGRHPDRVIFSTAKEDVLRRAFTITGLFYDPMAKRVMDYVQGRQDIRRRIIRTIGSAHERFDEDKLRMLRAVRGNVFPIRKPLSFRRRGTYLKGFCPHNQRTPFVSMDAWHGDIAAGASPWRASRGGAARRPAGRSRNVVNPLGQKRIASTRESPPPCAARTRTSLSSPFRRS
jgi:hypothetical protein